MGIVREYEDMQAKINRNLLEDGHTKLISEQINDCTELSVCIRPLCYDVVLGSKNILSLNNPENAVAIYQIMLADLKGDILHGNQSET